jgi:hypothetical protein
MNIAVVIAVIAGLVSAVGWLVNYLLSSKAALKRQRLISRLAHIEAQLKQLYEPLAFFIIEGRASALDLISTFGRTPFTTGEELSTQELSQWLFWVDNDFMPRNAAIQALLSGNSHLIVGESIPGSYIEFLDHYNSWRVTHLRWKQEGFEYSWHSKIIWPEAFAKDVMDTFQALKKEHARLIGLVERS